MPAGVALELAQSNITGADYPQILSVDPFAYGATTIDPARFKFQTQLPYVPVPLPGQFPTLTRFSISKSLATGTVVEAGSSYSVGITFSGDVGFLSFMRSNLSVSNTLTWTNKNVYASSTSSTLSASANIMQPAYGYMGSVYLDVYLDTIYNTFVFALR